MFEIYIIYICIYISSFSLIFLMPTFPQIIIPQKQVGRNSDIYVTMVSYTTQVSLVTLLILQRNETLAKDALLYSRWRAKAGLWQWWQQRWRRQTPRRRSSPVSTCWGPLSRSSCKSVTSIIGGANSSAGDITVVSDLN